MRHTVRGRSNGGGWKAWSLPGRGVRRRPFACSESGQSLVEFALVLPLLLLLVIGIFKFGVVFNHYLTLTDAVRSGARQLAVERGQGTPCLDAVSSVQTARGSLDLAQLAITVDAQADVAGPEYHSDGSGACDDLVSGDPAKVTATYPCEATILGIDFAPGCQLSASATERTE